jgi:hypothetical protein
MSVHLSQMLQSRCSPVSSDAVPFCVTCFLIHCFFVYFGCTFRCFPFCFLLFRIPSSFFKHIHAVLLCYLSVCLPAYFPWKCRNVALLWTIQISSSSYPASCSGSWGLSPQKKQQGHEADQLPLLSFDDLNAWNCTSTPTYISMAWCLIKDRCNFSLFCLFSGFSFYAVPYI